VSLLASGRAALETVGQIGVANFVEDCDDLLLNDVREFHFLARGHTRIYVTQMGEPRFPGKSGWAS